MSDLNNTLFQSKNQHQKQLITEAISNFIGDQGVKETIEWEWDRLATSRVEDTDFDDLHRPGAFSLVRLIRHPDFVRIRSEQSLPQPVAFYVDENARIYYAYENLSSHQSEDTHVTVPYFSAGVDITQHFSGVADFDESLSLLASIAKMTGGMVTSSKQITVGQWLRFHELPLPTTEEGANELIDLLHFATLPENSPYENYWQLLDCPEDSPFKLTEENRAIIRRVTEEETEGLISLAALYARSVVLESGSPDRVPARLSRLIDSAVVSSANGQAYIDALGWFAEDKDPKPTEQFIEQLMIAVMLLDLDPDADIANTTFAGFDLYSKRYLLSRPAQVRRQLELHLVDTLRLDTLIAPLVAELILGGMAPEYLALDLPEKLRIGTPGWVVFTQSVHFAEAVAPGISRSMGYQHLLGFSRLSKLSPQLEAMFAATSADPVMTWAVMNNLITRDVGGKLSQEAVTLAFSKYNQYVDLITDAASKLGNPLPHRKPLALKALKAEIPDCDPEELLVKHRGTGGGAGRKVSVIDLYLGDELHTEDWDRPGGNSIYHSFPQLSSLFPIADIYEEAIDKYYRETTEALTSNIVIALSQLKPEDADYVEYGALDIYCIRQYTKTTFSAARPGIVTDPVVAPGTTGRFGVILCAKWRDNVRCYEVFPLRLECNPNQQLEPLFRPLLGRNLNDFEPDVAHHKVIENIPVDVDAYLQNLEPRDNAHSKVFIRKIGELKAPLNEAEPASPPAYLRSPRQKAIGQLMAEENPYFTEDELKQLGFDQTVRERAIEKTDAVFNSILNLIIPFKECIEELSSGVPSRQKSAISGCVMDAALVAMSFAAVPGKIAATTAKTATVATRLLSASKVLSRTILSLFNPLDGLPPLLQGGGKLLGRGVKKLGAHALSAPHLARQQLRYLTGANTYDLLSAVDHTGAATKIRMSLDAVSHARTIFKADGIETADQVLKHLRAPDANLLKNIPEQELQHLLEHSLVDIALKSEPAWLLEEVLDPGVVDRLIRRQAEKFSLTNLRQFQEHTTLAEIFHGLLKVENKNLRAMSLHQSALIAKDLGKAPFDGILDELTFNPSGLTGDSERANAWILKASNSRNQADNIRDVLGEYSANNLPLTSPSVYNELHRRIAPEVTGSFRSPTAEARYPSNVSGAALLEKHLATLDPDHQHFAKQMLGAFLGYHSFVDGNGRTARAIYAIAELRKGRFTPLSVATESALSGLS
ncbi:Fic family protein [Pseudomonas sp. GL-B-19]|uniref:Fic family protein n=1 Tax=Pseudomonas sp. GL-B-19 TaxID=2832393 RepID=UPI001CBD2F5A|nr:Fic family protein [Pseudomonas sp. GL-B-19]